MAKKNNEKTPELTPQEVAEEGRISRYYRDLYKRQLQRFYRIRDRYRSTGGLPTIVSRGVYYASITAHAYGLARDNPGAEVAAIAAALIHSPLEKTAKGREVKESTKRAVIDFLVNPMASKKLRHGLVADYHDRIQMGMSPKPLAYAAAHTMLQEISRKTGEMRREGKATGYKIGTHEHRKEYKDTAALYAALKYLEAAKPGAKTSIRMMMKYHGLDKRSAWNLLDRARKKPARKDSIIKSIRERLSHLPEEHLDHTPRGSKIGMQVFEMASLAGAYSTYLKKESPKPKRKTKRKKRKA